MLRTPVYETINQLISSGKTNKIRLRDWNQSKAAHFISYLTNATPVRSHGIIAIGKARKAWQRVPSSSNRSAVFS